VGEINRRALIQSAALASLSFSVGGSELLLSPREARAQGADIRSLKPEEVSTLEAAAEILLPGAREAGIAHFVDHQVSGLPEDCLLMARIANVKPPFLNFYRAALNGLNKVSSRGDAKTFASLSGDEQHKTIDLLRQAKLEGWSGPPQPFVYFLLRQDAVDVVYGTVEGFEKLGIPYMPHILPEQRW
jgi:gluconate 2-dehydrogenase subunit 3-like protein